MQLLEAFLKCWEFKRKVLVGFLNWAHGIMEVLGGQGLLVSWMTSSFAYVMHDIILHHLPINTKPPPTHFLKAKSQIYAEILKWKYSPKVYSSTHHIYFIFKTFDSSYTSLYTQGFKPRGFVPPNLAKSRLAHFHTTLFVLPKGSQKFVCKAKIRSNLRRIFPANFL